MKNEDSMKASFRRWLKENPPPEFWFYCPTDHFVSGIPDVLFCARGLFGWIEFKMPEGKVTKIQEWTHTSIANARGYGMVCRSVQQARDFVLSFYKGEKIYAR